MLKRNSHNHNLHYGRKLALGLPHHIFATGDPADDPSLTAADEAEQRLEKKPVDRTKEAKERATDLPEMLALEKAFTTQRPSAAMLQKEVPGLEEAYLDPERFVAEEKHTHLLTEYNGVRNYIQYFEGIRTTLADPKTDYKDFRWIGRINKLADDLGKMHDAMSDTDFTMGKFTLSAGTLAGIRSKNREEVLGAMDHILDQFRRLEDQALINLKAHMKEDFIRRVTWLQGQWKTNTPAAYESAKDSHVHALGETLTLLDGLSDKESLEEYNKTHQQLQEYEDSYIFAVETSNNPYAVEDLEKEFKELEALKKEKIDPISNEMDGEIDKTLGLLDELEEEIKNSTFINDDFRASELINLGKHRKELSESKNMSKSFQDMLHSEEDLVNKDGTPLVMTMGDKRIGLKKGLKSELDILKNKSLPKEELRKYALGVHESYERAKKLIESTTFYKEKMLDPYTEQIQTQLTIYREPLHAKKARGWIWLSPYDFKTGYDLVMEWAKRRYKRASTHRIGKAGSQVLAPLSTVNTPLKTLPNEFDQATENAEQEEVNRYKTFMGNKDPWQIMDIARQTTNKDEFKACLFLLSDAGRIRWDDPQLLERFNYFQQAVHFNTTPEGLSAETANLSRFYDKLRRACGMWDYGTFNGFENTNNSNYEGMMTKYNEKFDRLAEQPGGLKLRLTDLLKAYKVKGRDEKVDPHEYEGVIRYAIDKGRMSPEDRMYYLIQGIAVGILSHNRASAINSKVSNSFAVIEYFAAPTKRGAKATQLDIIEVAALDYDANAPGDLFREWFHTVAMKLPGVTQRLDKALTQGIRLDHDDMGTYGSHMSAGTTESLLTSRADGFQLPVTGVQNVSSSMLYWLDSKAGQFDHTDPRDKQDLSRLVASFTTFDGITNDRLYRGKTNYFRWTPSTLDAKPRVDGQGAVFGRKDMTVRDYLETTREYIKILDPEFFGPIFEGKIRKDSDVPVIIAKLEERYPGLNYFGENTGQVASVDQLYKNVETYVNFLLQRNPKLALELTTKIQEDHKKMDLLQKQKDREFQSLTEQREKFEERIPQIFKAIDDDRQKADLTPSGGFNPFAGDPEKEATFKMAA